MVLGNDDVVTNLTEYNRITVSDMTQMAFEVILMVFVCTVNTLTLITVFLNRNLWTVPNMYIISLAVADFLTGLSLAYQIVFHIPEIKLVLDQNKYLCLFRHVLFFTMIGASLSNMILIAFDRWTCITFPLTYKRLATIQKAGILIGIAWIVATIIGSMPLYVNNWQQDTPCLFFKVLTMEYQVYVQGGFFIVCSIIIAACYGHIFRIAKREREAILRVTVISDAQADGARMAKFKRDWELVVMFGVVFGVFFLCSAPAFIFVTIAYTVGVSETVNSFTVPLLMMNSGMNFVIYVVKNSHFRTALKATCLNCRTTVIGAM
ncbi:adenosine receptor A3-like [Gigantopelta aegis]|uniref:adenosine receptor A3-like n=1 Tax=Gigantopelta aegis TaxID=1735272 RepID=UPI001B888AF6|nr:adenosine receptor A3-like [Gigantopelta aegis]